MVPTVGRVVYYQSYGTPNGEYNSLERTALITEVDSPGDPNSHVGLCVLNPTGLFFNQHVPFSSEVKGGTWHWMPYQIGQAAKTEELEKKLHSGDVNTAR